MKAHNIVLMVVVLFYGNLIFGAERQGGVKLTPLIREMGQQQQNIFTLAPQFYAIEQRPQEPATIGSSLQSGFHEGLEKLVANIVLNIGLGLTTKLGTLVVEKAYLFIYGPSKQDQEFVNAARTIKKIDKTNAADAEYAHISDALLEAREEKEKEDQAIFEKQFAERGKILALYRAQKIKDAQEKRDQETRKKMETYLASCNSASEEDKALFTQQLAQEAAKELEALKAQLEEKDNQELSALTEQSPQNQSLKQRTAASDAYFKMIAAHNQRVQAS